MISPSHNTEQTLRELCRQTQTISRVNLITINLAKKKKKRKD